VACAPLAPLSEKKTINVLSYSELALR
jgi:hypothetical protein